MTEEQINHLIEELLVIQARIIVLEMLYTKFVNVEDPGETLLLVEHQVAGMLRNERRRLVSAITEWIGVLS